MAQAFALNAPQDGYAGDVIKPGVVFMDRFAITKASGGVCDLVFFIGFVAGLVAHVIVGITMYASSNSYIDPDGLFVLDDELEQEFLACLAGRRLQDAKNATGLFPRLIQSPEVTVVMILIIPIIAALWLLVLRFASKVIVWGTITLSSAFYVFLGIAFIVEAPENQTVGILFIVFGGVVFFLFFLYKSKVHKTAERVGLAAKILFSKPQIFLAAFIIEVIMLGFIAFTAGAMIFSATIVEITDLCEIVTPQNVEDQRYFLVVYLLWIINYCDLSKLVVTAMSVGSYFFGQWETGNPMAALKIALTKSVGTISLAALISALCEWIVYEATAQFWWLNPLDCVLKLVLEIFRSCIMAYTRFLVIAHSFTAQGFFVSGANVLRIMERNFTGAYINDRIGVMVVKLGSTIFALGIAFASWQWIESAVGVDVLTTVVPAIADAGALALVAFFFLFIVLLRNPVPTLFIIVLFERTISEALNILGNDFSKFVIGPFVALFFGSIAAIVFRFQGDVILHAIDTLFLCSAIGTGGGNLPPEAQEFYTLLQDDKGFLLSGEAGSAVVAEATVVKQ